MSEVPVVWKIDNVFEIEQSTSPLLKLEGKKVTESLLERLN